MDHPNAASAVRILHLSDFHCSEGRAWDAEPILRELAACIGRDVADNGLEPDLVVITGDLAQSGKAEEYALAGAWLKTRLWPRLRRDPSQSLEEARLLLVPGNHDCNWERIGADAKDAHAAILSRKDQDLVADQLRDPRTRDILLDRHAAYLDFYAAWLGRPPGLPQSLPRSLPWWQRSETIRGQRLHLAGLDSAWLSDGNDDSRLAIGTYQINQTVLHADADDDAIDWRIALLHHPWESFAEFDRLPAKRTLHRRRDLILRGHLHQADAEAQRRPDPNKDCIELAAGCCYSGRQYPNAFQWIELYPSPRRLRVLFRRWDGDDWLPDGDWDHSLDRPDATDPASPGDGNEPLRETLRLALDQLVAQHRAALLQSVNAQGAADRVRAGAEAQDLERRIQETRAKLNALG